VILTIISYACSVWYEAIDQKYIIKPFITIQRQIALRISRAYKTVSIEAANIIANLMPIDLFIKQRATNYFVKNGINNDLTNSYLNHLNINLENIQKPIPSQQLPHFAQRNQIKTVTQTHDDVLVFTDGSKSTAGVGSAFCITNGTQITKKAKFKLAKYCSVFQAELFAMLKALNFINNKYNTQTSITLCTDSQSSIKALTDSDSCSYLVQQILQQVDTCQNKNIQIKFMWIRGHEGNRGNDIADQLAKQGASSHQAFDYDLIPVSYVKKAIYDQTIQIWNNRWTNAQTGEFTRNYFPTVFHRIKAKKFFTSSFELTQLLTNHGKFNQYLTRFHLKDNIYCEFCHQEIESADHVIFHCERHIEKREQLIHHIEENGYNWPCDHQTLINIHNFQYFKDFSEQIFD